MFDPAGPVASNTGLPGAATYWLCVDAAGNLIAASDSAAWMLGYVHAAALVAEAPLLPELTRRLAAALHCSGSDAGWRPLSLPDAGGAAVEVLARILRDSGSTYSLMLSRRFFYPSGPELQLLDDQCLPLLELSQGGFFIKTLDLQLLYVNRALADMLGYEPEEMTGKRGPDSVAPEGPAGALEELLAEPWQPGEMREVAQRLRMKHGIAVRDAVVRHSRITYQGCPAYIGSVRDVTDLRRSERALQDYARRLRALSQQILEVQENERRNLARELHDEVGQQFTLLKLLLEAFLAGRAGDEALQQALQAITQLTQQVRDISLELRPSMLDDLGLAAALRWYVNRVARLANIAVDIMIDDAFPRLKPDVETLYFRVAQEAVTNVMRHARARRLSVRLWLTADSVHLEIHDDGHGFNMKTARSAALEGRSAGILGMQERAALSGAGLQLESVANEGTKIRLIMPMERAAISGFRAFISGTS